MERKWYEKLGYRSWFKFAVDVITIVIFLIFIYQTGLAYKEGFEKGYEAGIHGYFLQTVNSSVFNISVFNSSFNATQQPLAFPH
jgi:hypothetical protein